MNRTLSIVSLLIIVAVLSACAPAPTAVPFPTVPSRQLTATGSAILTCARSFERHELREPYKRDKNTNAPRYTLSSAEFNALLGEMGVTEMCLPASLGAPYLAFDWHAPNLPAVIGRMIQINFEGQQNGDPYTRGRLVYATYDFKAATEYEVFATQQDYQHTQDRTIEGIMQPNDQLFFSRIVKGIPMGTTPLYLTYVFPSPNHSVAVVYDLGAYGDNVDEVRQHYKDYADFPNEYMLAIQTYSAMGYTIRFH